MTILASTKILHLFSTLLRSWFSGRMTAYQAVDLGSIPGGRIYPPLEKVEPKFP
jgi:hypothetical protein